MTDSLYSQLPLMSAAERECGMPKEGGFYLQAAPPSNRGRLLSWSWLLDAGIIQKTDETFMITAPPRSMVSVNLVGTIGRHRKSSEPLHDDDWSALETTSPDGAANLHAIQARFGKLRMALLDHVGEMYSPISFANEIEKQGPSRRVPEAFAADIARHLPLPIIFTHNKVPLVDESVQDDMLAMSQDFSVPYWHGMSYRQRDWGIASGRWGGHSHWLVPIMRALDKNKQDLLQTFGAGIAENALFIERPFGISWMTMATYVARPNDSADRLVDIANHGIIPMRLSPD